MQYTYDAAGNRLTTGGSFARTLVPDAVPAASYDAANAQLAFGTLSQTFDNNGNLATRTDGTGTTYTWDARNRLTGITGPGLAASFSYDALGRRAGKTVNGQDASFQYDGLDVVRESTGGSDVTYLRTLAIDEALTRTAGQDVLHYLGDALGSPVDLSDPTGGLATTYSFEPFGRTEASGPPRRQPVPVHGPGERWDGLVLLPGAVL